MNRDELEQRAKEAGADGITVPAILDEMAVPVYNRKNEQQKLYSKLRALERYGTIKRAETLPDGTVKWVAVE